VDARFADAHYQLAQVYLKMQDWQQAYAELSRTLEVQPENYKAHADIANLLIADGQVKMAKEHTDLLLQSRPDDPETHVAVANLLGKEQRFDAGSCSLSVQEQQGKSPCPPKMLRHYVRAEEGGMMKLRFA